MKNKTRPLTRLRYKLPLYAALYVVASLILSFLIAIQISNTRQISSNESRISNRLNYLQAACEIFYTDGRYEMMQKIISTFSAEEDLIALMVANNDGTIIASNSTRDRGLNWKDTGYDLNKNIIDKVISSDTSFLNHSSNAHVLEGYTSLCRRDRDNNFKKSECGFIFYRINIEYYFNKVKQDLFLQMAITEAGMIIGSFFLLFAIDRFVARRVNKIINGIRTFIHGDRKQKITVEGNDEIADLARSINSLFADIMTGEYILNENTERLNTIITTIIDGIIVINSIGTIEAFNPAAEKLFGYSAAEVMMKNIKILMPEPHHSLHDGYLENYIQTGVKKIIGLGREVEGMRKDGSIFPLDLAVSEMSLSGDRYFTGIIRDITERKELMQKLEKTNNELTEANERLNQAAITDGLTGLHNRRYFDERLDEELKRSRRAKTDISLILCDIDYFKPYNDTYGHQMGDDCLKRVSKIIAANFKRSGEVTARYGGEEFVIILPNTNAENALQSAEALRKSLFNAKIPHEKSKVESFVTMSLGLVSISGNSPVIHDVTNEKIIGMADEMLYRAKEEGRNRVIIYPV